MKLNEAVSKRLKELLDEKNPDFTIGNIMHCSYDSVKLRVIHELCQGLGISIPDFFNSPLFLEDSLEP